MMTLVFVAVLAILGFHCFTGPDRSYRPKESSLNRIHEDSFPSI
jgi:hypothetical protein